MKSRRFYNLYLDFDELRNHGIYPSDIDMIYKCKDGFLIIGEAKLEGYHVTGLQSDVLTSIIDSHKFGGIVIEIEHYGRVQDGAKSVNIAECPVRRAYFDGKWHDYTESVSVLQWMSMLKKKHGANKRESLEKQDCS